MPEEVKNRREEPRSRISGFQNAEIEFTGPDGTAYKRPLIELSVNGGSFQLPKRIPGLEAESAVAGGVIRVGESEIHVNFIIRRVTHGDGNAYEYGVQIYTMNEQDRNEMAALNLRLRLDADAIREPGTG
jgi:hypothetical protein